MKILYSFLIWNNFRHKKTTLTGVLFWNWFSDAELKILFKDSEGEKFKLYKHLGLYAELNTYI